MGRIWLAVLALLAALPASAGEAPSEPLGAPFLYRGELTKGELALEAALLRDPKDDETRFGLGMIRFVKAIERLAQNLHHYGAKRDASMFFVRLSRLPIPENPEPAPIDYLALRQLLDDFRRSLSLAEETLAGVSSDRVKVPLKIAHIVVDLDGDGKATDKLLDIMREGTGGNIPYPKDNPDFLICFDRGDVAWLRSYCHVLMGATDIALAFDLESAFLMSAKQSFAKPKPLIADDDFERQDKIYEAFITKIVICEPERLARFRRSMLQVAQLNRETWRYIRSETDDDHEWLPNPRQKGVLGLPVTDEMIDAWLAAVEEYEAVLEGKRVIPIEYFRHKDRGIHLKNFLESPPAELNISHIISGKFPPGVVADGVPVNMRKFNRVTSAFGRPMAWIYTTWFN